MRKKQLDGESGSGPKPVLKVTGPMEEGIMRKAIAKKMGESEISDAIAFLKSKDPVMGTMAVCSLTGVDWSTVRERTRNAAFCALESFAGLADRALACAARRVQKEIVNASVGGGFDEERKAA